MDNQKCRGRVAWSENPMDSDPLATRPDAAVAAAIETIDRVLRQFAQDTPGAFQGYSPYSPYGAPPAYSRSAPAAGFADSDMPADFDLMPSAGRSTHLTDTPPNRRRFHSGLRRLRQLNGADSEPETLRLAWANWYASHQDPYGHHRAAAGLRVKEIELLRALQGHGVHALHADLGELLGPLGRWGRVVVELRHPLGQACVCLSPTQVRVDTAQVLMIDPDVQFALGALAFAECFLIHGVGVFSLYGFDDAGEVVARLHLVDLARGASAHLQALPHLLAYAAGEAAARPALTARTGDRLTQPGWCVVERQVREPGALAQLCRQLGRALDTHEALNFMMESEAAILACQSMRVQQIGVRSPAPQPLSVCKLGLRAAEVRRASVCTGTDGRVFLRLNADYGHCLRFQHPGTPAEARAWIEALLPQPS
jgi:hypothetical protein